MICTRFSILDSETWVTIITAASFIKSSCFYYFLITTYHTLIIGFHLLQFVMSQHTGVAGDGNVGRGARGGNSQKSRWKFKKGDRLDPREEEILAATLAELVALGWKSDYGFRSGYLQKCEESIHQEFPTTDLKGTSTLCQRSRLGRLVTVAFAVFFSESVWGLMFTTTT